MLKIERLRICRTDRFAPLNLSYINKMSNKKIKSSKQGHQDDCEDCKREKKQNQALIAIYERLQAVDNNSKLMRKSLEKHKSQFQSTNSKFKEFVTKFNQIPKESKTEIELKSLGYDLAHTMMEEITRGPIVRENQRLKRTLAQMHKPKNINLPRQDAQARRSLSVSTNYEYNQPKTENTTVESHFKRTLYRDSPDPMRNIFVSQIKQEQQPESTRTTGFFSQENQPYYKVDGLNLWLYEQIQSKSIEEQLYETRLPSRYRTRKASKSKPSVLPALRTTRQRV